MKSDANIRETPLIKIALFQKEFGLSSVFIKDESKNPFGTIKDRRNFPIVRDASRLRVDKLVLITSGNNGYSLASFAQTTSVKVVAVISQSVSERVKSALRKVAYQILTLNLDYKILRPEELIAFAREKEDETVWEVTNGYDEFYIPIFEEILKKNIFPDYIVVPLGSGGIFHGIVEATERLRKNTKVIGIGSERRQHSIADKLSTPWTPYAKVIQAHQERGHKIYRLTEGQIFKTFAKYRNIVDCEYSSSVVFFAPVVHPFKKTDTIVFINSGKIRY